MTKETQNENEISSKNVPPASTDRSLQSEWDSLLVNVQTAPVQSKTRFLARLGKKFITIDINEVAYFIADNEHTYVVMKTSEKYSIDESIDELEYLLDPKKYFRLNRLCIAGNQSIGKVHKLFHNRQHVELIPACKTKILLNQERAIAFKQWFSKEAVE
jgi:two-component system, LytTR family, response regulator LytT